MNIIQCVFSCCILGGNLLPSNSTWNTKLHFSEKSAQEERPFSCVCCFSTLVLVQRQYYIFFCVCVCVPKDLSDTASSTADPSRLLPSSPPALGSQHDPLCSLQPLLVFGALGNVLALCLACHRARRSTQRGPPGPPGGARPPAHPGPAQKGHLSRAGLQLASR